MRGTRRPLSPVHCAQVRKAGVGIGGDGQKLLRDFGVACGGLVDLADMANERAEPGRIQRWSLAGASEPMQQTPD